MKYSENIEKIFVDDIREKKKAGRGVFSMRGKGVKHGFSGALRTPYHFMTSRERRKLNGKVEVTNMYDTIIPLEELKAKDAETQRNLLIKWRENFQNEEIQNGLGIGKKTYYDLIEEYNLPKKPRGGALNTKKKKKVTNSVAISPETNKQQSTEITNLDLIVEGIKKDIANLKEEIQTKEETKQTLLTSGLHLEYNGAYDVEALNKLFTKLQIMIDGDTSKYNIRLSLSEIVEEEV